MPRQATRTSAHSGRWRGLAWTLALAALGATAQTAPPPQDDGAAVPRSALDAPLFYQLLIGELELRTGDPGNAYAVVLDAARRTRDEALFRRAVEIALQARAGDQALVAAKAWRQALPQSLDASRHELQLLAALNRPAEMSEPLRALLERATDAERNAAIAGLPRLLQRIGDKRQAATLMEAALRPYAQASATRTVARVAIGRMWWMAGDTARALEMAERAHADDPTAAGPALLALELLPTQSAAQSVVLAYLRGPAPEVTVRLSYVRALSATQRYVEAIEQLKVVTREQPELPVAWLSLGALQLELRQSRDAEASLLRFLATREASSSGSAQDTDDDDSGGDSLQATDGGQTQAWLMLAQAADQSGDSAAASAWLDKIADPARALEVQTRRAMLLARQGKLQEARQLVQQAPERSPADARAKLLAESQVLREVQRWSEAHTVLVAASVRFPGDVDLLYEQAMMDEKLHRIDDMERVLRQVIALKPDHHHAYNALGYSLADRGQRLAEARMLIAKALELAPGDPFITDSLGWVEFRLGHRDEALRLLRQAYAARPDTEIAAHLGEVLWATGASDEARRVWREGRERDAANEVLRETLSRLQVSL